MIQSFNRLSLAEQAEAALRHEITAGRMAPGSRVNTAEFQASWNISSTPFRDALRALEQQGFVEIEPRKGVFVAAMDLDTLREIFDVRIALEVRAVELATPRIPETALLPLIARYRLMQAGGPVAIEADDRAVHDLARDHCGNRRLTRMLTAQADLFSWAQNAIIAELPHSYALALPEHLDIAEAFLSRDVGRSTAAMRRHLDNSRDRLAALRAA